MQISVSSEGSGAGSYAFNAVWSETINMKCFTKKKKKKSFLCQWKKNFQHVPAQEVQLFMVGKSNFCPWDKTEQKLLMEDFPTIY